MQANSIWAEFLRTIFKFRKRKNFILIRALNNLHFLASCVRVYDHSVFDFQPNFEKENENYRKEEFMIYRPRFGFYRQFVYKRISDVTKMSRPIHFLLEWSAL